MSVSSLLGGVCIKFRVDAKLVQNNGTGLTGNYLWDLFATPLCNIQDDISES